MWAERISQNELTDNIPALAGQTFTANKAPVGGIGDAPRTEYAKFGVGGLVSRYMRPADLTVSCGCNIRLRGVWPAEIALKQIPSRQMGRCLRSVAIDPSMCLKVPS